MEYIGGIEQLIRNAMTSTDLNRASVCLFGLIKLLESAIANANRVYCIWDNIALLFDFLSRFKEAQMELVIINSTTCLIINILEQRREKTWDSLDLSRWHRTEWQADMLGPLQHCTSAEYVKEVALSVCQVVEVCGPLIAREGWDAVLDTLERSVEVLGDSSLSPGEADDYAEDVFKCVEGICYNSFYKMHLSNIEHFLQLISYFINMKTNIDMAKSSVAFLQNVAMYLSQLSKKFLNSSPERVSKLWISLFAKLAAAGNDEREEVRSVAYRTLKKTVEKCGNELLLPVWSNLLLVVVGKLLSSAKENYFECSQGIAAGSCVACTPKFVEAEGKKPKTMKFDSETIAKDTEEQKAKKKAQEKSIKRLYSTLLKILLKFNSFNDFR